LEELSDVVTWDVKPNLRVLGTKFGKRLGAVRKALGELDSVQVANAVNSGQTVDLGTIDGEQVSLEPGDILVSLRKREGFAAAQGEGATVALDTELTDELIREGMARDFVRGVQDARKRIDLRIEQTIKLAYATTDELAEAIAANQEFIAREVLATSIDRVDEIKGEPVEVKVGDSTVKVTIRPEETTSA